MDDYAQRGWQALWATPKTKHDLNPRDAVRVEYLEQVLQPGVMFGFQRREHENLDEGPQWRFFQIIEVRTSHSRPHVARTADKIQDKHMQSPLSLCIQDYDARAPDDEGVVAEPNGDIEVYAETDPSWHTWNELAPFDMLRKHLQRWRELIPSDNGMLLATGTRASRAGFSANGREMLVVGLVRGIDRQGVEGGNYGRHARVAAPRRPRAHV